MDFNGMRKKLILEDKVTVVCVWLSICTALVILLGILLAVHIVKDDGSGDYVEVEYDYEWKLIYNDGKSYGHELRFTADKDGWARIYVGDDYSYNGQTYLDVMYHKGDNRIFLDHNITFGTFRTTSDDVVWFFERR